ncbi:MAG: D-alanine--D-alanine ligase family protein [Microbacterium sp.]|uniref:D-alanine--D-alanine ligase family protein n=1 Tax=Microbacterium sp. TaxID=51671 RepID=UPI003A83BF41
MGKTVVAVLFGGRSSEHSISSATAGGLLRAIDRDRYRVIPVGITRDGAFVLEDDHPDKFALDPGHLPEVVDNGTRILWPESAVSRELRVRDAAGERSLGDVDVVFPILHGRYGEDGTVQGMLELLGLPYVGAGVLMSAMAMDKHTTKSVLRSAGVPVVPWVTVRQADWVRDPRVWSGRIRGLEWPVFVKPARAGSSVGVSKVTDWADLDAALDRAFAEDTTVLVEQATAGRELECGVLQGDDGALPRVSLAGEIVVRGRDFYDFEAKYLGAPGIDLVCPAPLHEGELAEMRRIAACAFEAVGGEGLARIDFFFTGTEFFVNEVNTMPGFTPISMFPTCWLASGMTYPELVDELIQAGLARGPR